MARFGSERCWSNHRRPGGGRQTAHRVQAVRGSVLDSDDSRSTLDVAPLIIETHKA
jgi:hypothetical protein